MAAVRETDRGSGLRQWLVALALCGSISAMGVVRAQEPAMVSADAPPDASSEVPPQTGSTPAAAQSAERDVSERTIFLNILHDQKDLWLFPTKLSHENHWLPALVVAGVTAGLLAADAHDTPYFRRTQTFSGFDRVFSGTITNSEILIAPASFYVVGLFDKDAYTRKTGLLAAEALADVTVLDLVMKGVTRRLRPSDIPPYGNFSDTFFKKNKSPFSSSFPSGHSISAFAVATVIAGRYGKRHRWVPFVAYGVAGVIGFSRITNQAHFPSDVFLGAALGYAVAQFDVLRAPGYGPAD
jgi:membrane-associated phospholipid phosphatase